MAALLLLGLSVGLIAIGRMYPAEVADARARLAGPVSSILAIVHQPLKPLADVRRRYTDFVQMEGELQRLRTENDELKGWQWRAIELERQLADLSALNRVVYEPGFDYVTTRIMARSIGTGSRSALLGAGGRVGIVTGAAVLNQSGLVGTTYEIGPSTSRVRFLNDPSARLLVSIGRGQVTAVAMGTGMGHLNIRDGGRTFDIAVGDEVMAAGEIGGVPRGLRVGRVVGSPNGVRIEPYVNFDRLEFVSILVPGQHSEVERVGQTKDNGAHLAARLRENDGQDPVASSARDGIAREAPQVSGEQ